ncbi:uncharacterized protein [Struthio camelus]|uniref:uncharacterized protein n=1 Tax=Struthio camelus TaxID=8801 RepID=UPI00360403E4
MAGEDLQVFLQTEGESFKTNCSSDMHKSLHEMKFWCKELSEKSCPVLASSSPLTERMNLNHALRRSVDQTDIGRGWISVIKRALRRDDSGICYCEESLCCHAAEFPPGYNCSNCYCVVLATTYIIRKKAGKGMDFERPPAIRQAALQDIRNKASRMPDGELKHNVVYAVIRHQPQPKSEDVIYINIQPSPKVFFHLQEPPGNSVSSGPVEYATVIFRATTSHSGTEKKQTGPPKQSSTKPWTYS